MIDRKAILRVAMEAATHDEWGYDSAAALEWATEIDPDYAWEMDLLQAELEAGHRTMGPRRPPTSEENALRTIYEPVFLDLLRNSLLFKMMEKGGKD